MDSDEPATTDAAERRVEESRDQLDRHLDQLSKQLSPSNLAASALEQINPTERIKRVVKSPSVLVGILGTVVSLAALRRWRKRKR